MRPRLLPLAILAMGGLAAVKAESLLSGRISAPPAPALVATARAQAQAPQREAPAEAAIRATRAVAA
ncbi:MAG: hypothetical protein NZM27_08200, partial [Acetobacteraceae bacterium]|nr:hypothetical protein [Acetobacteraceae bacterium]MDW8397511.1 hypothetical protein [Acetobacteraceae bacterium]